MWPLSAPATLVPAGTILATMFGQAVSADLESAFVAYSPVHTIGKRLVTAGAGELRHVLILAEFLDSRERFIGPCSKTSHRLHGFHEGVKPGFHEVL